MEHLAEDVFLHILSFLPTFDAIKVCSLSRKWQNLWHLNPNLDFDVFLFDYHFKYKKYSPRQIRTRFALFVSRALLRLPRHSPPPHKFHLLFDDTNPIQADVDSWLLHAINLNVREIRLDFDFSYHKYTCPHTNNKFYDSYGTEDAGSTLFKFSYLVNTSVEVLKLRWCSLAFPTHTPIKIESLKSIELMDYILKDYEVTQLLSACVNLESLRLEPVSGFKNLKIVSPKLKELRLSLCYLLEDDVENRSLEIDAPCLRSITLISFFVGKYTWKCVPSLVEAHVDFESMDESSFACWMKVLGLITCVQRLTTQNMRIPSQAVECGKMDKPICCDNEMPRTKPKLDGNEIPLSAEKDLHGKLLTGNNICLKNIRFDNLKHLELLTGYTKEDVLGLETVFGTCPRLESVDLVYFYKPFIDEFLEQEMGERPIILHLPCLRLVNMRKFRDTPNELYVVGLLKDHGVVLEKIVAFPVNIEDGAFVL